MPSTSNSIRSLVAGSGSVREYPAAGSTAACKSVRSAASVISTRAWPVAKLTSAPATPGCLASVFCTRAAHEPQVIPSTVTSIVRTALSTSVLMAPAYAFQSGGRSSAVRHTRSRNRSVGFGRCTDHLAAICVGALRRIQTLGTVVHLAQFDSPRLGVRRSSDRGRRGELRGDRVCGRTTDRRGP